jgi:hypothetical protein
MCASAISTTSRGYAVRSAAQSLNAERKPCARLAHLPHLANQFEDARGEGDPMLATSLHAGAWHRAADLAASNEVTYLSQAVGKSSA